MTRRVARDQRLAVLDGLVSDYEAEHGEIAEEELAEQAQKDRDAAAVSQTEVRPR